MTIFILPLCFILTLFNCSGGTSEKSVRADSTDLTKKHNHLRDSLSKIIEPYKATVGVAMIGIEDRDTFSLNNHHSFPMQSVYKFPLALAVLDQVDKGNLSLDQQVHVLKKELNQQTWSPMRDQFPNMDFDITLGELLHYTVSFSDNNACDILFGLMKGPDAVGKFIHEIGYPAMHILSTEHEMHQDQKLQFKNSSEPFAMAQLLDEFYRGSYLSDSSSSFLLKQMLETTTGPKRIKGLLPEGTPVAHKTGTGGANAEGITSAVNDAGILTTPEGKHFALVVFVSETKESEETNEKIIAEIAKVAFDYFRGKSN